MKINIKQPLTFNEIGQKFNQKECIYPFAKKDCFIILCDDMERE